MVEVTPSPWLDERYTPRRPLKGDEICSIAIIGGGIVGVAAAWYLASRDIKVILLEKDAVASGATGKSAGFLIEGLQQHYSKAQHAHGRDKAATIWRLSNDNHKLLRGILEETNIGCDYAQRGSYRVAVTEPEFDVVCQSAKMLNQDGFKAELIMPKQLRSVFPGTSFSGGMFYAENGELNPVKFVRGLAAAAERKTARIYEKTTVRSVKETTITTDHGSVTADMVLYATNAYTPKLQPFFKEVVAPMRGQSFLTEAFPETLVPAPVYANWGMDYFRQLNDGRFLMGGGRHTSIKTEYTWNEKTTDNIQKYIEGFLKEHFPAARNLKVTHRWAGIMGFSCDDLPCVGPVPGLVHTYAAVGFHGHGLGLGIVSAKMVTEMMTDGRTEFPAQLLSARRHVD